MYAGRTIRQGRHGRQVASFVTMDYSGVSRSAQRIGLGQTSRRDFQGFRAAADAG